MVRRTSASFLSGPLGGPEALERKWMPAPNRPKPAKTYLEQFDASSPR